MKLEFQTLQLQNLGCFRAAQTLSLARREAGLYFLCGKNDSRPRLGANGVGKTTLWRAFTWALYGKTSSGLRTPDLQPWGAKQSCAATVTLLCDGKPHKITRSASPNLLTINNKPVEQAGVDSLIGLSLEAFSNTIMMAQGEDLFLDHTPRDKLQLLSDALQLERWEERARRAGKIVNGLETEANQLDGVIAGLHTALERTEQLFETSRAQAREWEAERQARLEGQEARVKELTAKADDARTRLDQAKLDWDRAGVQLAELSKDLEARRTVQLDLQSQLQDEQRTLRQGTREREALRAELKEQRDTCPTCGQSLKGAGREQHKADLKRRIAAQQKIIEATSAAVLVLESRLEAVNTDLSKLAEEVARLDRLADKANSAVTMHTTTYTELRTQLSGLQEQRAEKKAEDNPYSDQEHKLRRQISLTKTEITQKEELLAELMARLERTKFWVKGFRDVSLFLVEEVLQEVEATCNAMLADVGLDGWEMFFDIEKETAKGSVQRGLNVWVLSPDNDKPVRWECWSGGEGQRLRIVGALALSEVLLAHAGVQTNLEVLDEPTQHLSVEGTRDLCGFLAERAAAIGRQTWWVDHNAIQSNRFSGVVTVVRTGKGSHIEEAA